MKRKNAWWLLFTTVVAYACWVVFCCIKWGFTSILASFPPLFYFLSILFNKKTWQENEKLSSDRKAFLRLCRENWRAFALTALVAVALSPFLTLCWHYVLCGLFLWLCWRGKQQNLLGLTVSLTVLSALAASAGFYLIYDTIFAESGKSFTIYVTDFGVCSLPVFLCPLLCLFWTLQCRGASAINE